MWCRTAGWGDCSVGIFCNLACKPHKTGQFMKSGRGQGCEHASATKRFRARTSLTTCTCSMICYHSLYVVLTSFAVVYRLAHYVFTQCRHGAERSRYIHRFLVQTGCINQSVLYLR